MNWREKLTDPLMEFCEEQKNIFFLQDRVGQRGEIFRIVKFKTFYDKTPTEGNGVKNGNSLRASMRHHYDVDRLMPSRVWMRKLKIDELPQIINWLRGDLQLIGLRSLPVSEFLDIPVDITTECLKEKPGLIPGEQRYNWHSKEGKYDAMRQFLRHSNNKIYRLQSGIRALVNTFFHPANG